MTYYYGLCGVFWIDASGARWGNNDVNIKVFVVDPPELPLPTPWCVSGALAGCDGIAGGLAQNQGPRGRVGGCAPPSLLCFTQTQAKSTFKAFTRTDVKRVTVWLHELFSTNTFCSPRLVWLVRIVGVICPRHWELSGWPQPV